MSSLFYFNLIKLIVVILSIPMMLIKKEWLYILLSINIGVAAIYSILCKFWMNGLIGLYLIVLCLFYLTKKSIYFEITIFIGMYLVWNIYFTETVLENKSNNHGQLTSIAMNGLPFIVFMIVVYLGYTPFDALWFFGFIRLIIILFYYIHLMDTHSCHKVSY